MKSAVSVDGLTTPERDDWRWLFMMIVETAIPTAPPKIRDCATVPCETAFEDSLKYELRRRN